MYCFGGPLLHLLALLLLSLPADAGDAGPHRGRSASDILKPYEYSLPRMGTRFRIVLYDSDAQHALGSAMSAFERIEELEDILSDYRDESELNRLCLEGYRAPQVVSSELFSVLEESLRISRLSGGAFDVTIGPVVNLWRAARREKRLPDREALKAAQRLVGYENIVLEPQKQTVRLKLPHMRIDLGAIGKGYAGDEALALLRARGIERALIDAGGELVLGAPPPGKRGWMVTLADADGSTAGQSYLLHHVAVATSGDVHQFVEVGGTRYSHIIDPSDGMGVRTSPSVTVIARSGTTADALATALSIMPVADGIRLVESLGETSAAIVRRSSTSTRRFLSRGFPKPAGEPAVSRRPEAPPQVIERRGPESR
jgi:thiamine biosynthesis lipoprotein